MRLCPHSCGLHQLQLVSELNFRTPLWCHRQSPGVGETLIYLVSEMLSVAFVENKEKHTGSALPHSPAILMLIFWSSELVLCIRVLREWLTIS